MLFYYSKRDKSIKILAIINRYLMGKFIYRKKEHESNKCVKIGIN